MRIGILGSGSWGTALAKILIDNGNHITWWNRSEVDIQYFNKRGHNPHYLSSARFNMQQIKLSAHVLEVIADAELLLIAIPSAFIAEVLSPLDKKIFDGKKILSAVKGILPEENLLLNDYLKEHFNVPLQNYFAVLGPCHAEEVAAEKLSYLTFSGVDDKMTIEVASLFKTPYLNVVTNKDIYGVQYAAVLKNIYALGAGIANGLDYGDNFMSVLIANSADEMAGFLRNAGIINAEVGYIDHEQPNAQPRQNYAASVYLGDLLVTCYSLHSRNRAFGNMIGKGYSVMAAKLEMNMVAEGVNASKCIHHINENIKAEMPIATTVYDILWKHENAAQAFNKLEKLLV